MELLAWVFAYLVGFAILQFYLYRYFVGGNAGTEETTLESDGEIAAGGTRDADSDRDDGDLVRCGSCGSPNRNVSTYTYCRECGGTLS